MATAQSLREKQKVVPPMPSSPVEQRPATKEEAEKILKDAGWELSHVDERGDSYWTDPISLNATTKSTRRITLPGRDGSDPTPVSQVTVPPARWQHNVWEAVGIQRVREQKKAR